MYIHSTVQVQSYIANSSWQEILLPTLNMDGSCELTYMEFFLDLLRTYEALSTVSVQFLKAFLQYVDLHDIGLIF